MPKKNISDETVSKAPKKNNKQANKKLNNKTVADSHEQQADSRSDKKQNNVSGKTKKKQSSRQNKKKTVSKQNDSVATLSLNTPQTAKLEKLNIAFLGGLNEIGKNLTMIKYGNDCILIDCGIAFPDAEMFGVDLVIPDFSFIERNRENVLGIFITHGHEDHIGGLPYLLRNMNIPVYATCLTCGLIEGKLSEHHLLNAVSMHVISPGDRIALGDFEVEGKPWIWLRWNYLKWYPNYGDIQILVKYMKNFNNKYQFMRLGEDPEDEPEVINTTDDEDWFSIYRTIEVNV